MRKNGAKDEFTNLDISINVNQLMGKPLDNQSSDGTHYSNIYSALHYHVPKPENRVEYVNLTNNISLNYWKPCSYIFTKTAETLSKITTNDF